MRFICDWEVEEHAFLRGPFFQLRVATRQPTNYLDTYSHTYHSDGAQILQCGRHKGLEPVVDNELVPSPIFGLSTFMQGGFDGRMLYGLMMLLLYGLMMLSVSDCVSC